MPLLPFPAWSSAALVAVGDPSRDRTVYATIVLLVALGFTMIMLAVWLVRSTRPDPEVLAPLERMGQRKWRRADPVWQRRRLDEVRPGGADPLEPMSAPPDTDAEFERGPQPIGFDDLVVSSDATDAPATELPAPAVGAVAVDGPGDVDPDAGDAVAADQTTTDTPEPVDTAGPAEVVDEDADGVAADGGSEGDDDEDITGEQDTDDFLAVLDRVDELDPDVETDESVVAEEPEAEPADEIVSEPAVASDDDAVSEPEAEPAVASDDEPETDSVSEPDDEPHVSDPEVDSAGEPDAESEVDSAGEPGVESEVDPASEPGVESEVERSDDPDVDERDEPG